MFQIDSIKNSINWLSRQNQLREYVCATIYLIKLVRDDEMKSSFVLDDAHKTNMEVKADKLLTLQQTDNLMYTPSFNTYINTFDLGFNVSIHNDCERERERRRQWRKIWLTAVDCHHWMGAEKMKDLFKSLHFFVWILVITLTRRNSGNYLLATVRPTDQPTDRQFWEIDKVFNNKWISHCNDTI